MKGIKMTNQWCLCKMQKNQVLLFLVTLYATCSIKFIEEASASAVNRFKKTSNTFLPNTVRNLTAASNVMCCMICDQSRGCNSVNYDNAAKECQLSIENSMAVDLHGQSNPNWSIHSKIEKFGSEDEHAVDNDWMLVFRATLGAGGDVRTAWKDGVSVTTDDVTCMTTDITSCSQHYRNPIADSWEKLGVTQVKFAFFTNNNEVAFVIFNATGSDALNWFEHSRVIQSSWAIQSDTLNIFSITGDKRRTFYLSRAYGGCTMDLAYAAVIVNVADNYGCSYDMQSSYPQFLYSTSETYGKPGTMEDMDYADVMAIFIK